MSVRIAGNSLSKNFMDSSCHKIHLLKLPVIVIFNVLLDGSEIVANLTRFL